MTGHVEYAAGAVRVGYAFQNERYTSGTNQFDMVAAAYKFADASGLSAMATYDLSKRTRLYTALRKLSQDRGDGFQAFEQTRYGVGMRHVF